VVTVMVPTEVFPLLFVAACIPVISVAPGPILPLLPATISFRLRRAFW
jgi:hypothetical protein